MPNSYAQTQQIECPDCGQPFEAEIWQIVDTAERPDLVEKIREGALHTIPCAHCDYVGAMDVPLLLYRPEEVPHLLFSSAQGTSQEEIQQQAAKLIGRLRDTLGPAWQDHWLEEGLQGVQRQVLPAMLSDDPEAALQEMAERQAEEIERLRKDDPEQYLQRILLTFLQAPNLEQKRQVLEQAPELLDENTDQILEMMIQAAQEQGNKDAQDTFEQHRTLLHRCREEGVEAAFTELPQSSRDV